MRMGSFVATLGVKPQVVTLALDELLNRGMPIDRAVVIHTDDSIDGMRESVGRLREEASSYYSRLDRPVEFRFVPIERDGRVVSDILTEEDAGAAFRAIYKAVLNEKREGRVVHLSIAGGRKVMSVYGMAVAQLLFDDDDRVWHLVSEDILRREDRLHARPGERVVLVPVPVLRWSMVSPVMTELVLREDPWEALKAHRRRVEIADRIQLRYFLEHELTRSERELVELLVSEGLTNVELAERLHRSPKTVANQLNSVYRKYRRYRGLSGRVNRLRLIADLREVVLGRSS
ncbi:histidine kinase [Candidatus Poribacteria bacterium]|nr:MAG: histidine kinase [Candidatus Poribacteria bacterium]